MVFYANGTTHEQVVTEPFDGVYKGETFSILYDPEDLVNAEVLFYEPVYDKQACASTSPTTYGNINLDSFIEFTYKVGKEEFSRYQARHPDETLDAGRPAKVFYKPSDPRMAYLEY